MEGSEGSMDTTDIRITDILKRNARISFQELGDRIGLSRVAAKKRVRKLEEEGIIRGYNTCIYRDDEITMLIDIVTTPGGFEEVLKYVCTRTAYIRQIFRTTKENHIHMIAVSDSVQNLAYLTRMIRKGCGDAIVELHCHAVKEVIKDVYGGTGYEDRSAPVSETDHEQH
jgi:DNA-binding Lrp family transcriptional regulator